jgi:glutaredoxin
MKLPPALSLRVLPVLLLLVAVFACAVAAGAAPPAERISNTAPAPDIEAFVRDGCPHCAKAEAFLAELQREQPALSIVVRDVGTDEAALARLKALATSRGGADNLRVPALSVRGQLIVGFSSEARTDALIRAALAAAPEPGATPATTLACAADASRGCDADPAAAAVAAPGSEIRFFGRTLALDAVGLPLFTLALGLLDGLNPCAMWVLILMLSLLATQNRRSRMLAVAGTFVLIQGLAYYGFMAAWLNVFLFIGLSRASEIAIGVIAIGVGAVNLKDFRAFGRGVSLAIPDAAKPGIYARMRAILRAESLAVALVGTVVLGLLVQVVELLCTSGFPALYTRILTLRHLDAPSYYGYLLLYNLAYMLDDAIVLTVGVITLSQHRLQEKEGRWLKLASGLAMVALGMYLILRS